MIAKNIFKKRKTKKKFILFYFILLITIIFVIYFYSNKHENGITVIPEYKKKFYIIPKDKGGQKVANLDKKSLNLQSLETINENVNLPNGLRYSIQIYSDTEYENVNNYLKKILSFNETIYKIEDFYILALSTEIGIDYFLIYKNFETRQEAQNYCYNYLSTIENCLIVDTTKF
mgnify:CR=1 FL=1